jgi:hypothetical protein
MPWRFEMKKFENFHFWKWNGKGWNFHIWNLKWNFRLKFEKKGHITRGKWRNHIFRLCHRDKTFNNIPIPLMYTTLYHMGKLWWYTNLSRRILPYWSFSNSGIG